MAPSIRLAVDIGGTFTDLALEQCPRRTASAHHGGQGAHHADAPEQGVIAGVARSWPRPGWRPADVGIMIHGTTLATNALIERKGASTGAAHHRGLSRRRSRSRNESRYEQYDLNIELPPPLVPRQLRLAVPERIDAAGKVLHAARRGGGAPPLPSRSAAGRGERRRSASCTATSMPAHERARRDDPGRGPARRRRHARRREVSPEMREYERFSTACANAYVQPLMARYLGRPGGRAARASGFACPLFLMTVGRRAHHAGDGPPLPGAAGGVGPGRRRHLRRPHRAPSAASTRCCPSTWAAPRPRSA